MSREYWVRMRFDEVLDFTAGYACLCCCAVLIERTEFMQDLFFAAFIAGVFGVFTI
jgi:hypothetical protein